MVMNAVSLNLAAGAAKQSGMQENDSGFSSVLDNVNSESRQQGCANQTKTEFKYSKKAVDAQKETVSGMQESTAEFSSYADSGLTEKAEVILDEAMVMVAAVIQKSDSEMSEDKIADMLIAAVKQIVEQKKNNGEDGENIDAILEMLMSILGGQTEETAGAFFAVYAEAETEMTVSVTTAVHEVAVKHDEAAMLTESEAEVMTAVSEENADVSENTVIETEQTDKDFAEQLMASGTADEASENIPVDLKGEIADKNLAALNELLDKAKEELGLTEAKVTSVTKEETAEDMRTEQPVETSVKMSKSDRSGELDYILSGGKEEHDSVKTETYDAVHMASELIQDRNVANEASVPEQLPQTEQVVRPPEVQAAEQIIARMETMRSGETEFTMVLNPESLGRITVKLVTAGERVAVEITAENAETRELLAARTESLQSMLKDNGVELERYQVVEEHEDAELMQQSYDGSSKNPYGRQQEQEDGDDDGDNFYDILQQI